MILRTLLSLFLALSLWTLPEIASAGGKQHQKEIVKTKKTSVKRQKSAIRDRRKFQRKLAKFQGELMKKSEKHDKRIIKLQRKGR
ncbi:hypothetical protein [Persicobacter sp. CCB-QB2]|uniref:hypothetical protein n=1 Tax=Persicobacter sp. CCB-QB2 TaxID=1561025 RepID=UPI0006A9C9FC|nr:hypothetical protein [Persicobacter sp. CCB-QB2]